MAKASHSSLPSAEKQRVPSSKQVRDLADHKLNETLEQYSHSQTKTGLRKMYAKVLCHYTDKQVLGHMACLEICLQTANGYPKYCNHFGKYRWWIGAYTTQLAPSRARSSCIYPV